MTKVLKKLISLFAISAISLSVLVVNTAYAAAPQGTMTGTAQTLTVSTTPTAINTLTITDHSTAEIVTGNDICIKIPSGIGAVWDTSDTTATMGGSASGDVSTTVSYTDVRTLKIDVTTNFSNSEALTISGLSFVGRFASSATALQYAVDNTACGSATYGNGAASTQITVNAGDAAASLALAGNSVVGASGNSTLTLTTHADMASTDTIVFTAPAHLDVSSVAFGSETFGGAGTFSTCSASSQTITCTAGGAITAGTGTIVMTGITSSYAATSTTITSLAVNNVATASGADISSDSSGSSTDSTAASITTANIEPQTLVATAAPVNVITFTNINAIPNLGKIKITYPSGFNVSGANGRTAFGLSGLDGTWTASVSGQVITLTQTGGGVTSVGSKSLSLEGIVNPSATGSAGTYTVELTNSTDGVRDSNASVTADVVISGGSSSSSTSNSSSSSSTSTSSTSTTTTTTTTDTSTDTSTGEGTTETTGADSSTGEGSTSDTTVENGNTSTENVTVALKDVNDSWAKTEIEEMVGKGIVKGNPDGEFKPNSNLNRAEAAILICRVMELDEKMAITEKPFNDVMTDAWYGGCVSQLKANGVVAGNPDGSFKPANNINRAEFLKLAMSAYTTILDADAKAELEDWISGEMTTKFSDMKDKSAWYAGVVTAAEAKGFLTGKTCMTDKKCVDASSNITRAEATAILHRMFIIYLNSDVGVKESPEVK